MGGGVLTKDTVMNIRHIEYLQFDDIDTAESLHGLKPMSDEDAGCIVDALIQYVDEVSQIIVHCDAGYSRSPAVAAALAKALGESDEEFFGHDYCINNHVYTTLLKQLSERKIENSKIVAESCERHSIEV